ncbi:hypothetical protein QJS10_CPA08g01229 [Acorus calamus]|uniref:Uncharacterized protein n=1 Tax=Acorus calamus TaxID=4465 RepID=A0AAV9ECL7_ACOCL|nr:hypothetical protein QJS10_CPA08g01229 [Acorus calamus]
MDDESEFQINMEKARLANKDTRIGPTASSSSYDHNDNFTITHGKEMLTFGQKYPYMEAEAGELTVEDVHKLLSLYKQMVTK